MSMLNKALAVGLIFLGLGLSKADARYIDTAVRPNRIAFGSCNIQLLNQEHWEMIDSLRPDLWVWLGDMIYADLMEPRFRELHYVHLYNDEYYKVFRQNTMIVGTWDDHDYGYNDMGAEFGDKRATQRLALDFLDEPYSSPRRQQEGIYTSYTLGHGARKMRVIMLDERYFRQPRGENADVLGAAQWRWLEGELLHTPRDVELTLIASSSQLLNLDSGDTWRHYPQARQRLLNLIDRSMTGLHRIIVLSGDRHFAELSGKVMPSGHTLYEVTASGLTHNSPDRSREPNRYRKFFSVPEKNFGMMDLDWTHFPVKVSLQLWTILGENRIHFTL